MTATSETYSVGPLAADLGVPMTKDLTGHGDGTGAQR